jgi:putative hydrolase of the HAD superfamily
MGTLLRGDDTLPYWEDIGQFLEHQGCCSAAVFARQYAQWRRNRQPSRHEVPLRQRVTMFAPATERQLTVIEATFLREYQRNTHVIDGVEAMLARWHGHAVLGVVSNFFLAYAPRELLRSHQLLRYFDFVLDSAQVGFRKPHRAIFERALSSSGHAIQPADATMIGDDWQADVQGALSLGLRAIHFSSIDTHDGQVPVLRSWHDFSPAV